VRIKSRQGEVLLPLPLFFLNFFLPPFPSPPLARWKLKASEAHPGQRLLFSLFFELLLPFAHGFTEGRQARRRQGSSSFQVFSSFSGLLRCQHSGMLAHPSFFLFFLPLHFSPLPPPAKKDRRKERERRELIVIPFLFFLSFSIFFFLPLPLPTVCMERLPPFFSFFSQIFSSSPS